MATLTVQREIASTASALHEPVAGQGWSQLYRIGGAAALGVIVLIPFGFAAFIAWPTPTTAADAFAMFARNTVGGLLAFDLLLMVSWALSLLVFLALYPALRPLGPARMGVALALEVCAFAIYFSSNTAFSMLTLSDRYAAAATDGERLVFLAAGEAMMALYTGTAFNVSYLLAGAAALLMGLVMLRSGAFGRKAGYALLVYAVLQVPPTAGAIGMTLAVFSLAPMVVWLVLVARGFFRLARPSDTCVESLWSGAALITDTPGMKSSP